MKKGDIVKLRGNLSLELALVLRWLPKDTQEQELYTVSSDEKFEPTGCGDDMDYVVTLEEFPATFKFIAGHFEVAVSAGEPDLTELLKEKERRLAYVGF